MSTKTLKKIAILADPLDTQNAGVYRALRELLNGLHLLDNLPFELILVRGVQTDEYPKFKTIIIPLKKGIPGFQSLRLFTLIPRKLTSIGVHAVYEPAHFGPFSLPKHVKRITFIHDLTPLLFSKYHNFNGWFLQRLFLPGIIKRSDLILTNSENTKKDIIEVTKKPKDKIKVNYLGSTKLNFLETDKAVFKNHAIQTPYFLTVGSIEPRKNIPTLLKAFKVFKDTHHTNHVCVLVGRKGWKNESIYKEIQDHHYKKEIYILTDLKDGELACMYKNAEALIYPSEYEGFGLPILEAMNFGTSVIAAENSSLPEVGGSEANYFPTHDHLRLAELMFKNMAGSQKSEQEKIKIIKQAKSFDWGTHVLNFVNNIETILSE